MAGSAFPATILQRQQLQLASPQQWSPPDIGEHFVLRLNPATLLPALGRHTGAQELREGPAALEGFRAPHFNVAGWQRNLVFAPACYFLGSVPLNSNCVDIGQGGGYLERVRPFCKKKHFFILPQEVPRSRSGYWHGCTLHSHAGLLQPPAGHQLRWEGAAPRSGAVCWHTVLSLTLFCQLPLSPHQHHHQPSGPQDPTMRHRLMATAPLLCLDVPLQSTNESTITQTSRALPAAIQ